MGGRVSPTGRQDARAPACAGEPGGAGSGAAHRSQGARPHWHCLGRRSPPGAAVRALLGRVVPVRPGLLPRLLLLVLLVGLLVVVVVVVRCASPVGVRAVSGGRPPSAVPLQQGSGYSQPWLTM